MYSHGKIPSGLTEDLLYLQEVFQPEAFPDYDRDYENRVALAERIKPVLEKMASLLPEEHSPVFLTEKDNVELFSAEKCICYLFSYLRLSLRQGGGDSFISLWRNGTALKLVQRLSILLTPPFTLETESVFLGRKWCTYSAKGHYNLTEMIARNYPYPPTVKVRDDADVGMATFREDFYTFEEYYQWYHEHLGRAAVTVFRWSDLTEIIDNYPTISFNTYNLEMDLNTFLLFPKSKVSPPSVQEKPKPSVLPVPSPSSPAPKPQPIPTPVRHSPQPTRFTPVESELFKSLLREYMGTVPEESGWEISVRDFGDRILWDCSYEISGFNYCAEDEYSISVSVSICNSPRVDAGLRKLQDPGTLRILNNDSYYAKVCKLLQYFFPHARNVWMRNKGHYLHPDVDSVYVLSDMEFIFEDLFRCGKTVRIRYCNSRVSSF